MKVADTTSDRVKEYIKKNLVKGYTLDALRISLIHTQGYSPSIVDKAINEMNHELAKQAPILEDTPKISYEMIDESNKPILIEKTPLWKRMLGFK
jgi:hypothetical protein